MTADGLIQIGLYLVVLIAVTKPLGWYMARVYTASLREQLRPALTVLALLTVLTGVIYPLAMTGLAQLIFPDKANGSIITHDGQTVGSELIGQSFDDPKYFWGRL